jgi:glutamate--cysteine ligase
LANGFLSYRSHIWTDVDNRRAGMLPFVFEDGFGFERYVDYALDVPMYFVYRLGKYIDVAGRSFRDFLGGRIPELKSIAPTMADWADHLTTIFPEVRMKKFLEMRGADAGSWRGLCGLPALWVGIYYDQVALDAAWDLVKDWTAEERQAMRDAVPRQAFNTPFRDRTVGDLAREMLAISSAGLRRRAREDAVGGTEEGFLQPLIEVVERGYTRAEELLRHYNGEWNRDLARLFTEYNFL